MTIEELITWHKEQMEGAKSMVEMDYRLTFYTEKVEFHQSALELLQSIDDKIADAYQQGVDIANSANGLGG
jgi:hypothetical protein